LIDFLVDTSGYWAYGPVASNPNRQGGSDSTRPMASHDAHSSASSLTLRVYWAYGPVGRLFLLVGDSAYIVEQYSGSDAHIERIGSHRHVDANPLGTKLDALLGQSVSLVSK